MKYLFTLFVDERPTRRPSSSARTCGTGTRSLRGERGRRASGRRRSQAELHRHDRSDRRGRRHIVSDGPVAETKEQLGGYYLLDCSDLDPAIAWAKKIPMRSGGIEVPPVMDCEAAGSQVHSNEAEVRP
jgi:hypothetical protein